MKEIKEKRLEKEEKSILTKNISERVILNEEALNDALEMIRKMSDPKIFIDENGIKRVKCLCV